MKLKQILEKNYTLAQVHREIGKVREGTGGEAIEQLGELEEQVEDLPRLRLTIAFKPGKEQVQQIGQWVRENVNEKALLDLRYDKSLIAGARVVWQSRARDFSLKSKLAAKRKQITQLLPS